MKLGTRALILLAFVTAAVFARLGLWQLGRLSERRAFNAELAARTLTTTIPTSQLPVDTANAHYRRVSVDGAYDYGNEIVLTLRSRNGSPGVNIITPVRFAATDTALVVVRGWVYSANGMTVDLPRWREGAAARDTGFVETFPPPRKGQNISPTHPNAYRWLDRAVLEKRFGYPIARYYVVLTSPVSEPVKDSVPRLTVPPMDEGSHQSYAIQWFSFAAISIIGMTLFIRRK